MYRDIIRVICALTGNKQTGKIRLIIHYTRHYLKITKSKCRRSPRNEFHPYCICHTHLYEVRVSGHNHMHLITDHQRVLPCYHGFGRTVNGQQTAERRGQRWAQKQVGGGVTMGGVKYKRDFFYRQRSEEKKRVKLNLNCNSETGWGIQSDQKLWSSLMETPFLKTTSWVWCFYLTIQK